jgi:hypothetical protein
MVENPAGKPIAVLERSIRQDIPRLEGKRAGYVEGHCVVLELRRYAIARELLRTSLKWVRKPMRCVGDRSRSSSTGDSSKSMCLCAADAARRKIECVQGVLPHDMSTGRRGPRGARR